MQARWLIASLALVVLSACATAARQAVDSPRPEPAATAAVPAEPMTAAPAVVDEVSTDVDHTAVVCRKEVPLGTRLKQTVCRPRADVSSTGHW